MKFGIDYFPDAHPDRMSGRQYFEDVLDLAAHADELGYDSVKIVEHYFTSYGGYSPDPCLFLAACSQRTRRMRMVTGEIGRASCRERVEVGEGAGAGKE